MHYATISKHRGFSILHDDQSGAVRVFYSGLDGWKQHDFSETARDRATAIAIAKSWIDQYKG